MVQAPPALVACQMSSVSMHQATHAHERIVGSARPHTRTCRPLHTLLVTTTRLQAPSPCTLRTESRTQCIATANTTAIEDTDDELMRY